MSIFAYATQRVALIRKSIGRADWGEASMDRTSLLPFLLTRSLGDGSTTFILPSEDHVSSCQD